MSVYSTVRSLRWQVSGYPADACARSLQESETWSSERLHEYRDTKLRNLIAHCYDHVPYYRQVMEERRLAPQDIKKAEDLKKLPVLTRDLVRKFSHDLVADNVSEMRTSWTKTGGTTGEPTRICKNDECKAWSSMCYERGLRWGGKTIDQPKGLLFGGTLGIEKVTLRTYLGNLLRGDVFLPAFELRRDNAASYFDRIRSSRCRFIVGYASALFRLAVLARELDQKVRLTSVFPTAELLLPEWEKTIGDVFQCQVLPFYGCGEVNSLGFTAPESGGYLIPEEHALMEAMQPDGSTDFVGDGRFLVTDLDNYAMPILRYANGDAGKIVQGPTGDFPFAKIETLHGRYNSLLLTDKGDLISGVIGTHVFRLTSSVESYRIIQEEPRTVLIRIVPKGRLSAQDEAMIRRLLMKYLGDRMAIRIEIVSDLPTPPSGKSVFVINKCLQ